MLPAEQTCKKYKQSLQRMILKTQAIFARMFEQEDVGFTFDIVRAAGTPLDRPASRGLCAVRVGIMSPLPTWAFRRTGSARSRTFLIGRRRICPPP